MDFNNKYALLDVIPGDGASSYRGRQLASGRDVTVHLLRGAPAENDSLLSRIRALQPESLREVVEIGEQDGTVYLVTAAPPHRHISEWLSEQEHAPSAEPGEFTRFFQPNSFQPPAGSSPGEFTRLFAPGLAPQPADVSQVNTPNPEQGSGEYTRLIAQSPMSAAPSADQMSVVRLAAPAQSTSVASAPPRMVSTLVTLILCLLAFVVGGALVFLILRH
jgi:hypothetical protein